jgi:aminopeptidase
MSTSSFEKDLQEYAELTVKVGLNLQPGQRLVIVADIETAPLIRLITARAYQVGCRLVDVIWDDDPLTLIRFQHAPRDSFEEFPAWVFPAITEYLKHGDAFLGIAGSDPDLLAGQDSELIGVYQRTRAKHRQAYSELISQNATNWSVVAYPVPSWAACVFPDETPENQVACLWNAIFDVCRVKQADPIATWQQHLQELAARSQYLNTKRYRGLKYSGPGTDLYIGLAAGHLWISSPTTSKKGVSFVANMPTEEVFTLPDKDQTHGVVTATKPLSYMGTLIEDFSVTFENGRAVNVNAAKGEAVLRQMTAVDEGAARLGEVALVPHHSPISLSGLRFQNTLFDENAASHIALGHGYQFTLRDGGTLSEDDFAARGGNVSNIHVDFMIGSDRIDIDGVLADGTSEPVMRSGDWAFDI